MADKKPEFELDKPKQVFEELENKGNPKNTDKQTDYKTDNQLMRAVDILKAVRIYRNPNGKS